MDTHRKWLLHRAISILIFNKNGEMLLQKRASSKYHCGWLWTNATCTHPSPEIPTIDCAHKRLQEEMWFDCDLQEMFSFIYCAKFDNWLTENEYDHVFIWRYNWNIQINTDEAESYKRITLEELEKDITKNPQTYTPRFIKIIKEFRPKRDKNDK